MRPSLQVSALALLAGLALPQTAAADCYVNWPWLTSDNCGVDGAEPVASQAGPTTPDPEEEPDPGGDETEPETDSDETEPETGGDETEPETGGDETEPETGGPTT